MAPKNPTPPSVVPMLPPALGLRGTWRTQPKLQTDGGHSLLELRSSAPTHSPAQQPPHPSLSPSAPALPGKSLAGHGWEEAARQRGPPLRAVNQGFVCANLEPRGAVEGRVWAGGWAR